MNIMTSKQSTITQSFKVQYKDTSLAHGLQFPIKELP